MMYIQLGDGRIVTDKAMKDAYEKETGRNANKDKNGYTKWFFRYYGNSRVFFK